MSVDKEFYVGNGVNLVNEASPLGGKSSKNLTYVENTVVINYTSLVDTYFFLNLTEDLVIGKRYVMSFDCSGVPNDTVLIWRVENKPEYSITLANGKLRILFVSTRGSANFLFDDDTTRINALNVPITLSNFKVEEAYPLITDRTASDVAKVREIAKKIMDGTISEEEVAEFNSAAMKGAYNYTDLNRVTEAMEYLDGILSARGYITGYVPVKDVWYAEDVPVASQMQQYLSNVAKLKAVVSDGVSIALPADMVGLTIAEANTIEQILVTVNDLLMRMLLTLVPTGTATSGGDYL